MVRDTRDHPRHAIRQLNEAQLHQVGRVYRGPRFDQNRMIDEGRPIPVFGDGTTRRDYTYVEDILQGVRAAMNYDVSQYEVINLGESQTVELWELIALIEKEVGKTAVIDRQPMQPGDVPITYADISRAREKLGYNPTTKIADGVPKFVEWYRENLRKK